MFVFSCDDAVVSRISPVKGDQSRVYLNVRISGIMDDSFPCDAHLVQGLGSGQKVVLKGSVTFSQFQGQMRKTFVLESAEPVGAAAAGVPASKTGPRA